MTLVALAMLCLVLPPIGLPLLALVLLARLSAHAARDGGLLERRAADRRMAAEPWWHEEVSA